jgi:hypothetical protein
MLIVIEGDPGSGKTLFLTMIAYLTKIEVVSNFTLKMDKRIIPFDLTDFLNARYESEVVLIDESYILNESRNSQSTINKLSSYILFQSRKKDTLLFLSAQLLISLDIRYRYLTDVLIKAEKTLNGFRYSVFILHKKRLYMKHIFISFEKAQQFYAMFDTNETIKLDKNPTQNIIETKAFVKTQELRNLIVADSEKEGFLLTADSVKLWGLQHELKKEFIDHLIVMLKAENLLLTKSQLNKILQQ